MGKRNFLSCKKLTTCAIFFFVLLGGPGDLPRELTGATVTWLRDDAQCASFIPRTLARIIEEADVVVVGSPVGGPSATRIEVFEVLKGQAGPHIQLIRDPIIDPGVALEPSPRIFALTRNADSQGENYYFLQASYSLDQKPVLVECIQAWKDPSTYLTSAKFLRPEDLCYILGGLFSAPRVDSAECPPAASIIKSYGLRACGEIPWQDKGTLSIKFLFDPAASPSLKIDSMDPDGALAKDIRCIFDRDLPLLAKEIAKQLGARKEFLLTMDNRPPPMVGRLPLEDALKFLRTQLQHDNPDLQSEALASLTKLNDLNSVPLVIQLLPILRNRKDLKPLHSQLVYFLGCSRDERALEPLCRLLNESGRLNPTDGSADWDVSEYRGAILEAFLRMRDQRAVPCLEAAIADGLDEDVACIVLGVLGTETSFELLLESAKKSKVLMSELDSFRIMVNRSNIRPEPWMTRLRTGSYTDLENDAKSKLPLWIEWWANHRSRFKIISPYSPDCPWRPVSCD